MDNIFDQFDPTATENVFDQFDEPDHVEPETVPVEINPTQQQQFRGPNAPIAPVEDPRVRGALEVGATIGSSMVAEPLAGLAGVRGAVYDSAEKGVQAIESVREGLTYQPETEEGQAMLASIGEFMKPVGDFFKSMEDWSGDVVFEATGSPTLAALGSTAPALAAELFGAKGVKGVTKAVQKVKSTRKQGKVVSAVKDAVPTVDELKETSRNLFNEIDDVGIKIRPDAINNMYKEVAATMYDEGLDPDVTSKAYKALKRLEQLTPKTKGRARKQAGFLGGKPIETQPPQDITLRELMRVRSVAQKAMANPMDKADAALGRILIDNIDDFVNQSDVSIYSNPPEVIKAAKIGQKHSLARKLWGRARRSELIEDAFEKARNASGGFDKGVVSAFRAILNNKKQARFFSKPELSSMQAVVRGGKLKNAAAFLGQFDLVGKSPGMIGTLGVAHTVKSAGPLGLALPFVGYVSNSLAKRLVARKAKFANDVIRAGNDANMIADMYIRHTPKAQRSADELSQLLMREDVSLHKMKYKNDALRTEARLKAAQNRAKLTGALSAGQVVSNQNTEE